MFVSSQEKKDVSDRGLLRKINASLTEYRTALMKK